MTAPLTRRMALTGMAAGLCALAAPLPLRAAPAARVAIAGGDLTEIAFALGQGGRIIAADTTSTWPEAAASLPKFGYLRRLSAEGMLSTAPDLVLLSPGAGPAPVKAQLQAAGLNVLTGPLGDDLSAIPAKIRFVAEALGVAAQGAALEERFAAELAAVDAKLGARLDGAGAQPGVLCVLSAGSGPLIAAGRGTAPDAVIRLARGRNLGAGMEGYKPLSPELAMAAAPDALLLPAHAAERLGGPLAATKLPVFAGSGAARDGRAVVMDALKLMSFGLRTPRAAAELAAALHPGLAAADLL